ncbi:MAG: phosphatidylcholine/phosphatidylserine synthase [Chlamydiia bacterium]|nr:phosphatidylcholine/phosphatidylserine synthase [Chlamydiia bacterium]
MKRIYFIPNAITAFGLACGLFVIFKLCFGVKGDLYTLFQSASILILLAAVADLADGAVARLIKAESEFGGQFDSLADAVTFGVAPPLLALKSISVAGGPGPLLTFFVIIAAMIYSLCGVLRLVRFNIRSRWAKLEADNGNPSYLIKQKRHFTGLPIPAAGMGTISLTLFLISPFADLYLPFSVELRCGILTFAMMILGYFMVSRWKFPSVKALHFRVPSFYLVFATGIITVAVLYGILDYFALVFFILSWLYLFTGAAFAIIRRIVGKRSRALLEYEPEPEEEDEEKSFNR